MRLDRLCRVAVVAAIAASATRCGSLDCDEGSLDVCHVLLETRHPWHSVPGLTVTGAVAVPLMVVALPAFLLESGGPNTHTSTSFQAVLVVAMVPGTIVGGALYSVLYPLEWAFPLTTDDPPPRPPDPPAPPR